MGERQTERVEWQIRYDQLPSQHKFHEATERFKGYSGPIGSGKSMALCQEALRLACVNAGRTGLLGAPTYKMLRDSTVRALIEILASNAIPFGWNRAEGIITLGILRSQILLRSLSDPETLRGTNLAWFGVDELTYAREEAWTRLEGRLRDPRAKHLCGFAVWTPKGLDWVYRRFISEPREGCCVVKARPGENRHILDVVPDFYERLRTSYDETLFRQEVLGEYLSNDGARVYRSFDRDANLRRLDIRNDLPLVWALDFNVTPMSSLVVQVVGQAVHVLGEIVLRRASTLEACDEFAKRYLPHRAGVTVCGDAAGRRAQTTGSSDYAIIREFFRRECGGATFRVPAANPAVRDRVALVNSLLKNAAGDVRLLISPDCKELVRDLEEVMYVGETNQIDKNRDRDRTHLSDALGYLAWEEFGAKPKVGEQGQRLI